MRTFYRIRDGVYGEWDMTPLTILLTIIVVPIDVIIGTYITFVYIFGVDPKDLIELCKVIWQLTVNFIEFFQ